MSIIIMNLLVGLAVDDITSVMREATLKRLEMRVKLTLDVEKKLPKKQFFNSIRSFRMITYEPFFWRTFFQKVFRTKIKTTFDKHRKRLEEYGLLDTAGNLAQKSPLAETAMMNLTKIDDKSKSTAATTLSTGGAGLSPDWISNVHAQISTKYNEFNRHMADLKAQQDKINNILQQFPPATASRHNSQPVFAPTT